MQSALRQQFRPCQAILQCTAASARSLRSCSVTASLQAACSGGRQWVTLADTCTVTLEVKHSKFIATAWPIQSRSEVPY